MVTLPPRFLLGAVVIAGLLGVPLATGPGAEAGASGSATVPAQGVVCPAPAPPPSDRIPANPTPAQVTTSGSSETKVQIVVEPVTMVLLASDGTPSAVQTNSGQRPRCGDLFYVTSSPQISGARPATLLQIDQIMSTDLRQVNNWSQGWHRISQG
jgi:hypothetical protein